MCVCSRLCSRMKRIQFIYRMNDGKYRKYWREIDSNRMITLEHVWKDLKRYFTSLSDVQCKFYCYQTERMLPSWYHIDRLKDGDQILIENNVKSIPMPATTAAISPPIKVTKLWKNQSKQKQMKAFVTNRCFVITNKNSLSTSFYRQWEEGKMHTLFNMFFRDKVAKVSLKDMLEIQERLGTKNFTKALQKDEPSDDDDEQQPVVEINKKIIAQPATKSAPLEVSSKRHPMKRDQIPVHMRGKKKIVDPRFSEQFGDYDARQFRESYHFVTDMRRRELTELKKQLKSSEDPIERTKLKTVINRLKSQVKNVDDLNRVEKISREIKEQSEQLASGGEATPYITKKVRKVMDLASKYTDLKNTGRIDAYLSKKRKRLASKQKKQLPTRRVEDEDD